MLLLSLFSFGNKKNDKDFRKNGVSFKIPPKWKIIKQEPYGDNGYYVALRKKGRSGIMAMLIWSPGQSDLDEYLQWGHATLTSVLVTPAPQATCDIYDHSINGIKTRSFKSEFTKIGTPIEVVSHAFHGSNKTIALVETGFKGGSLKNQKEKDFKLIEDSFTVL